MLLAVALIPPEEFAKQFIDLSTQFSESCERANPNLLQLSETFYPHITVVHVDVEPSRVEAAKRALLAMAGSAPPIDLQMAGLNYLSYSEGFYAIDNGPVTTVEVLAIRSKQFEMLQAQIVDDCEWSGGIVRNGTGENARPHVTIGLVLGNEVPCRIPLHKIVSTKVKDWTLSVGPVGERFTYDSRNAFNLDHGLHL